MGEVVALTRNLDPAIPDGDAAPWALALRSQGRAQFARLGVPHRRVEAWRYSDLSRALAETPKAQSAGGTPPVIPGAAVAAFEDGKLDLAACSLAAAGITPLAKALTEAASPAAGLIGKVVPSPDHAIVGLSDSQLMEGVVLHVPRGKKLEAPVHIRYNWTGAPALVSQGRHIRVLIALEEGAEATVFESHTGTPGFSTVVTELSLAPQSRLTHVRLETLGAAARQAAVTLGSLGASSGYKAFYFSEGGAFARNEVLLALAGEGAEAHLDGAYLTSDSRHCDNTTVISHAAPHTTSRQAFRGVLAGKSRSVYQGCVKVQPGAQQTDARQLSRALLLSRSAEIATKPELEIFADDVQCAHGATAGELDAAALFFLRARGIPEAQARALLIEAFLGEALATIDDEALRAPAAAAVDAWLAAHAGEVADVG